MLRKMVNALLRMICTISIKRQVGSYGTSLAVNRYSRMTKHTYIGDYCNFNGMLIQGRGEVRIGNYFHCGQKCWFITDVHNYEGSKIPYDEAIISKPIIIGDFVWLGSNVMMLGGINVGEGAIIQAGSVVVSNIPPFSIAGGHPAKVFKMRDVEHFLRLKGNGMVLR